MFLLGELYNNNLLNQKQVNYHPMFSNEFLYHSYPDCPNLYFPVIWVNNIPPNFNFADTSFLGTQSSRQDNQLKQEEAQNNHFPFLNDKKLSFQEEKECFSEKHEKVQSGKRQHSKTFAVKGQGKKDQNTFRNILPNIIHQLVIFIQKKSKSKILVDKILKSSDNGQEWSANRFYLFQRFIKEKTSHYLNEDILKEFKKIQQIKCQIFSLEEQKQYLRVSRVLVGYFVKNFMRTSVLTSTRMKQQIKTGHLELLRYLEDRINEIYME